MIFSFKRILNDNDNLDIISEDGLRDLKKCLAYMYEEINEACEKHGISLCASNGTALGAVRHKGFIPWDDDLDLAMKREDYNRFGEVYERELKDRYNISYPHGKYNATNRFLQLYRKGTTLKVRGAEKYPFQKMYIDIFPVDYVPDRKTVRWIKGMYCNFFMMVAGTVSFVEYCDETIKQIMFRSAPGKCMYYVRMAFGHLFKFKSSNRWFHYVDKIVQNKPSGSCGILVGRVHYFGEIIPTKAWFPFKTVKFENTRMNIPTGYKTYLSKLYGTDYMDMPPVGKREGHHIAEFKTLDTMTKR